MGSSPTTPTTGTITCHHCAHQSNPEDGSFAEKEYENSLFLFLEGGDFFLIRVIAGLGIHIKQCSFKQGLPRPLARGHAAL